MVWMWWATRCSWHVGSFESHLVVDDSECGGVVDDSAVQIVEEVLTNPAAAVSVHEAQLHIDR